LRQASLPRARKAFTNERSDIVMKRLLAILLLAGFVAGCNTMRGAGEDLEAGGEKMQQKADEKKNY
jgi:predicted small secreted protein